MGYSGFVVVARAGDTRLDELACVEELLVAVTDDVRPGGWRIGHLGPVEDSTTTDELVRALARETAGPAAVLWIVGGGEAAFGSAADPSGLEVEFCLAESILVEEMGEDGFEPINADALPTLLTWAANAGLTPDPPRLTTLLEEAADVHAFVEALGIAPPRD